MSIMTKEMNIAPIAPIDITLKEGNNTSVWAKRHHCFTINNYKQSDKEELLQLTKYKGCLILVAQTETGDDTQTNHIQGYMQFAEKERPRRYFSAESTIFFPKDKKPWKGNVKERVRKACMYCSKPDRGNPVELWGIQHGWNRPTPIITKFYSWERSVLSLIKVKPDNRTILYIFGDYGSGKTVFAKYLAMEYGYMPLEGGKRHILDVASRLPKCKGFTFLLGKATGNIMSYEALEKVKDGIWMSHFGTKGTKPFIRRHDVHCIVFANVPPHKDKYHPDKTIIMKIKNKMLFPWCFGCDDVNEQLEETFYQARTSGREIRTCIAELNGMS